MPFTKIGPDQYRSPSGRLFNQKQVDLYHAHGGFPEKGSAYRKSATRKKKRAIPSSQLAKRPIGA